MNNIYANAENLLNEYRDREGTSILDHSLAAPFMLVLLRHIGCSFCRETLKELSDSLRHITGCGYRVGLVHMDADEDMEMQLKKYGLQQLPRFRDADRNLYKAFGLPRAPLMFAFNGGMWSKGIKAGREHGVAWPKTDPRQLPGVFLIDQGKVIGGESTLSPEDHPDFLALLIRQEAIA